MGEGVRQPKIKRMKYLNNFMMTAQQLNLFNENKLKLQASENDIYIYTG